MSDYGMLEEVREVPRGSTLAAAAAVGATTLLVDYGGDFDAEVGGTLDLNGAQLTYTTVIDGDLPDDPDTIVLAAALTTAADLDDAVIPMAGGQILTDQIAHVTMGDGDQVLVTLTVDQRSQWALGVYEEPVPVSVSDDLLRIEDAPGWTPSQVLFRNTDAMTVDAVGPQNNFPLTYAPIDGSLQVWWNGHPQPPTEWSVSGATVTIPDATNRLKVGDKLQAYYAYDPSAPRPILRSITLRGTSSVGGVATVSLPTGTVIGDTILLIVMNLSGSQNAGCGDQRVSLVDSAGMLPTGTVDFVRVYMGTATSLADLTISATYPSQVSAFVLTFAEAMAPKTWSHTDNANTSPKSIPSINGSAALCVAAQANSTATGGSPVISGTGWSFVADSGTWGNSNEFAVASFLNLAATSSPAGSVTKGSGDGAKGFWAVTIGVVAR